MQALGNSASELGVLDGEVVIGIEWISLGSRRAYIWVIPLEVPLNVLKLRRVFREVAQATGVVFEFATEGRARWAEIIGAELKGVVETLHIYEVRYGSSTSGVNRDGRVRRRDGPRGTGRLSEREGDGPVPDGYG